MAVPPALAIVGAPGSGKTLLITSLTEALRVRGYRCASATVHDERATLVLPNGSRATIEMGTAATVTARIESAVAALDPRVDLLLIEGSTASHSPTVCIDDGSSPGTDSKAAIATVTSSALLRAFEASGPVGPAEVDRLVDTIVRRCITGEPSEPAQRGMLTRLRGLLR